MSEKILVDPQELRDTAAHFHHSSAEIERITTDLRNAAASLDTGCWPAGEAARLTARFAEAEAEGRRLACRRAELGDILMRTADAFEQADMVTVQASMGLAPGWLKLPSGSGTAPESICPLPIRCHPTRFFASSIRTSTRERNDDRRFARANLGSGCRI